MPSPKFKQLCEDKPLGDPCVVPKSKSRLKYSEALDSMPPKKKKKKTSTIGQGKIVLGR